ncbi:hypothetical protein Tsubulata_029949 [Turnera subulata]|uniref:DUF4283 domain-containing protein n=1 Tax=Turnera subulata TaxID=218843 RepID=A0A9Q0F5G9_9ROSI|nr:hypothetical protein Tsubulata_029949 [Turnera subulata]
MTEGQPSDGGLRPPATAPTIGADTSVEPPRSFRDTLTQGSVWNEPTIDTNFAIEDGDVIVIASLQGPIGRSIGYRALSSRLSRVWQLRSGVKVIDLEHNYYMVKFYSYEDYIRVLTGGPWMILGQYLSVETWRPNFNPSTHKVSSVVA